jgi:hypothetical protein
MFLPSLCKNRFLLLSTALTAAYAIVLLAVNSYHRRARIVSLPASNCLSDLDVLNGWNYYFSPEGRQPRLLRARETGRPVIVSDFDKACG